MHSALSVTEGIKSNQMIKSNKELIGIKGTEKTWTIESIQTIKTVLRNKGTIHMGGTARFKI